MTTPFSLFTSIAVSIGAILWTLLLPESVKGQDQILDLLPRKEAIYLWTDDLPKALEQIRDTAFEDESIEQLWKLAESQRRDHDSSAASELTLFERLELLSDLWEQFHDVGLLDGETVLIFPVDSSSLHEPGTRRRDAPSITNVIFAAHTRGSREDFERFFDTINALRGGSRLTIRDSANAKSREEIGSPNAIGHWAIDGEWMCWTPNETESSTILDHLNGRFVAKQTLKSDRNFQTVMRNLATQLQDGPLLSIYVTNEALPLLAWEVNEAFSLTYSIRQSSWKELFLDELRGFGGRLYLNSGLFDEGVRSPLAMDAFLLMTQPRQGVLGALGSPDSTGIRFDLPAIQTPIERFSQVVFDSERLFEGVADVRARVRALNPESDETSIPPRDDPNTQIFALLSRLTELTFAPRPDASAGDSNSRNLMLAQINDPARFESMFSLVTQGNLVPVQPSEIDAPISDLREDDFVVWGRSEKSIEEERLRLLQQIRRNEEAMIKLEQSEDRQAAQRREVARITRERLEERLQRLEGKTFEPGIVMVRDWMVIWNFAQEENQREFVDSYGAPHSQLLELQEEVEAMKDSFANPGPNCGIIAFWADHIINRTEQRGLVSRSRRVLPNTMQGPEVATDEINEHLRSQFRNRIDKLVITLTSDDDGFRVNAAVIKSRTDDPGPQADSGLPKN